MSHPAAAHASRPLRLEIAGIPFAVRSASPQQGKWMGIGCRRFATRNRAELTLRIRTSPRTPFRRRAIERHSRTSTGWALEAANFRIRERAGRSYLAEIGPRAGWGDLLRTWFSLVLLERGGILLHAAAVVRDGRAVVACGPSGSGKTTLARLAGAGVVLSDETVAILPAPGPAGGPRGFRAYATPFYGEMVEVAENRSAPIAEVLIIEPPAPAGDGSRFRLSPVPVSEAVAALLAQTFLRASGREAVEAALSLLCDLVRWVRVRRFAFEAVPGVWDLIDAGSR